MLFRLIVVIGSVFALRQTPLVPLFDGHRVIRFPSSRELIAACNLIDIDIWGSAQPGYIDIFPSNSQLERLTKLVKDDYEVVDSNMQARINAQLTYYAESSDWHANYHTFDEISSWLEELAQKHSDIMKLVPSIGTTFEGRSIPMVKITGPSASPKKQIWLQGLQHAREWISASSMQFMIDSLLAGYKKDKEIQSLLDQTEVYIVPVCNPDGYNYSWKSNRLWRKNRSKPSGVDTNRNWPDHWGTGGSSSFPWSDTYMGPSPASELEIKALIREFNKLEKPILAVDFHAYSQLILRPYGWSEQPCDHEKELSAMGKATVTAIKAFNGTKYISQRVVDLYLSSGGSNDYWYARGNGTVYAMAVELSPSSQWDGGFVLPPKWIRPVGNDALKGMLEMAHYALKNPL